MDRDTDREGLRFPLRYNLIGIDCNSWGLSHIHTLSLPHTHNFTGTGCRYNNKCRDNIYE